MEDLNTGTSLLFLFFWPIYKRSNYALVSMIVPVFGRVRDCFREYDHDRDGYT